MPIYEFRCLKCGCEFERITLKPLGENKFDCPKCNSTEVEKLISAPGSVGTGGEGSSNGCSGGCCGAPPSKSKFT